MRARYSAYATGQVDYLASSLHPEQRRDLDLNATRRWSQQAQWLGLKIVAKEGGGPEDEEGLVEFVATYKERGLIKPYRERARFRRQEGNWYYVDGEFVRLPPAEHDSTKVGRNAPCPCGSGKKFKKCCGR